MTYFEDLSAYAYNLEDRYGYSTLIPSEVSLLKSRDAKLLNIGWLGLGHSFNTGIVDDHIYEYLKYLAIEKRINQMRGWHDCEFCRPNPPLMLSTSDSRYEIYLGSAEIYVEHNGIFYIAPDVIIHYIDSHGYLPPAEFIDAVKVNIEKDNFSI